MKFKKISLLVAALLCARASASVTNVPSWYQNVDNLLDQMKQVRSDVKGQIEHFQTWDKKLQPWCEILEAQNKQRYELHNCIRETFAKKDAEIRSLNITLSERKNAILDLEGNITTLERIIVGLNKDLSDLEKEIIRLKESYKTLLELDEAKAATLLAEIASLKVLYEGMDAERETFRGTLQSFYQCVGSYNHTARTENASFSEELNCKEETA